MPVLEVRNPVSGTIESSVLRKMRRLAGPSVKGARCKNSRRIGVCNEGFAKREIVWASTETNGNESKGRITMKKVVVKCIAHHPCAIRLRSGRRIRLGPGASTGPLNERDVVNDPTNTKLLERHCISVVEEKVVKRAKHRTKKKEGKETKKKERKGTKS
ncbi:MAG: hypothetical protein ACYTFQ_27115 [Planctomycetota bacterium]